MTRKRRRQPTEGDSNSIDEQLRAALGSPQPTDDDRQRSWQAFTAMTLERGETERPASLRRRRFLRRFIPAIALAATMATAGVAAAFGLFPWQASTLLDQANCRLNSSAEELVATAHSEDGRTFQLWITSTDGASTPNGYIVVIADSDGQYEGSMIGCDAPADLPDDPEPSWVMVPFESSARGILASVIGHVPPSARSVVVGFSDGSSTQVEVGSDGYFLGLITRPELAGVTTFPVPVHLTAIGADQSVIADKTLD